MARAMPSEEFMERVLTTGRNDEIVEDEVEEVEATETEDAVEEEELAPAETDEEPEEDGEGEPEADDDDQGEEEHPSAEAEPVEEADDAAHEDDFYLGRYKNREEAERGWLEKEQMISQQGSELAELRREMAELTGYVQGATQAQPQGDFDEWADAYIEAGQGIVGAMEAQDAALTQGDRSYVDAYVERWKDHEPFEAARFIHNFDLVALSAAQAQQEQNRPPAPQAVLNGVWLSMADEDPDLRDPEIAAQVGAVLKGNAALRGAATSGVPDVIRDAIAMARDGVRMQSARPAKGGTPRKVKSSDAERTAQAKLDASVTTGDSAPDRGNGSTPDVPPELQDMMGAIQRGEAGFPKLRE